MGGRRLGDREREREEEGRVALSEVEACEEAFPRSEFCSLLSRVGGYQIAYKTKGFASRLLIDIRMHITHNCISFTQILSG